MKKIKVEICIGTTCFVMGGSQLQSLAEICPRKYKDQVEVVANTCLDYCNNQGDFNRAPYAKVDDEVVEEATIEKILAIIDSKIKE